MRMLIATISLLLPLQAFAAGVSLSIWTRLPQEMTAVFYDGFRKLHPEIDLQVEYIPGGKNHINKLMASVAAKAPPDLTTLDVIGTAQFAHIGALMPLDELIATHPSLSPDLFSTGQVQTAMYQGKHEGLPFGGDISLVFYNKDLYRANGLDPEKPPRTWNQFVAAAHALTHPPEVYGFEVYPGFPTTTTFYGLPFLWMAGGTVLDPKTNLYAFNSDAGARALGFLADLHLKEHVLLPSSIGKGGDADLLLNFLQKRVAMTFGGAAQIPRLSDPSVGFPIGVMPMPSPSVDIPNTGDVGGDNVAIMASIAKDKLPAAITLMEYLVSAEGQRNWWASKGLLPVRRDMLDDPYYATHPLEKTLLAAYVAGHQPPDTAHYVEMQQYLRDAYQQVFFGQASPKDALDEAVAQGNALIKRTGTP